MSLNGVRRCEVCGAVETEEVSFHVHHKDGNRLNDSPDNLMLVCPSCHSKIHIKNNPMMHGKMNFGERVKQGLVSEILGLEVCPKCGLRGYGVYKSRAAWNPKLYRVYFLHVYRDMDGVRRQTTCYLGSKGKRIIIKGRRRVEHWWCSCGFESRTKADLILHVMEKHGIRRYEGVREWIWRECRCKVRWVKRGR